MEPVPGLGINTRLGVDGEKARCCLGMGPALILGLRTRTWVLKEHGGLLSGGGNNSGSGFRTSIKLGVSWETWPFVGYLGRKTEGYHKQSKHKQTYRHV